MTILEAILYGIVQGITEWLPISSTAHLRILPTLLHHPDPGSGFTAVIQLGTTLAVILYFAQDLKRVFLGWARSFKGDRSSLEAQMGWGVFFGTLPIIVFGLLFKSAIKSDEVRSLYVISGALIVMGLIMLAAEKFGSQKRSEGDIQIKDGILIGLWQALALIPGTSRSGSTISGALFAGFDRTTAARYSFLLSLPSVAAAGIFELLSERKSLLDAGITNVLVATFVSFVVGYASIAWLIKSLSRYGFTWYVVYRIVLAVGLLIAIQQGWIPAISSHVS
jgi:undecaprenyl-diphosphatase